MLANLPDPVYLWIYPKLLAYVNKKRAGVRSIFRKLGKGLFLVKDQDHGRLFFYEKTRMELYCWPDGVANRLNSIRDKYQHEDVRVESGDTVVDVGSNIGEFSLSICTLAGKVYAFEPDPVPFNCLEKNAEDHTNIFPFKIALSDRTGVLKFFSAPKTADSSIVEPDVPYEQTLLDATTLDDFFADRNEKIDFLKVEAEGWEPEVLRGATRILSTSVRKVAVDAGPERKGQKTSDEVTEILRHHKFRVVVRGNMVFAHRTTADATP